MGIQRPILCAVLLFLCLVSGVCHAATDTRWLRAGGAALRVEVVDVEDPARRTMLHRWVRETTDATKTTGGSFPLRSAYIRVQEIDSRDASPVPWGQTRREGEAGVLLYVRRNATYDALRNDWTATHELSHLFHPYLGKRGRWLAEGLASYWQNALRARAGWIATNSAWERLDAGFRRGEAQAPGAPMDAVSRQRGHTMRIYWAGAAYWLEADLALRREGDTSLDAVLDEYSHCCLRGTAAIAPEEFVAALDRIAGGERLTALYRRHAVLREFPGLEDSYRQLGIERSGTGLRFSGAREAARMRDAIMAPKAVP